MQLHFDAQLPHQRDALQVVLGLFEGPPDTTGQPTPEIASVRPNVLPVDDSTLLANLQRTQTAAGLAVSPSLPRPSAPHDTGIDVALEMETGTGKTYTYVRTIVELSKRHGLNKWLIIAPSIAVREGVLGTLRDTREHFRSLLPGVTYRFWAYDGRPERMRSFATAATLEIAVLTIAAFNKISNRLRRPDDRFGGLAPLDWVAAARPCLVLDEPHHYGSVLSKESLSRLHPLVSLRFGATPRDLSGLVHRLDAAQAVAQGLVKRVEVAAVDGGQDHTARLSAQIHETVRLHVQRQTELAPRGVKVLSLFFVDHVASYADDDGIVRTLFDRHFEALKHGCPTLASLPADKVRSAYFATKGRARRAVETSGDSAADTEAYQLIMRDKARLLSLEESVSFVFSHSALREGWDNPNVFQVCTLAPRTSQVRRRQEIGRGIRLCVNQAGRRVGDPTIDVLTVVPAEPYETFIAAWQAECASEAASNAAAPTPSRVGEAVPERVVATVAAVPWVALDSDTLIAEALTRLGASELEVAPHSEGGHTYEALEALVTTLLARRRPTVALSPATIAAVVAAATDRHAAPEAIAEALAAAVTSQGG